MSSTTHRQVLLLDRQTDANRCFNRIHTSLKMHCFHQSLDQTDYIPHIFPSLPLIITMTKFYMKLHHFEAVLNSSILSTTFHVHYPFSVSIKIVSFSAAAVFPLKLLLRVHSSGPLNFLLDPEDGY